MAVNSRRNEGPSALSTTRNQYKKAGSRRVIAHKKDLKSFLCLFKKLQHFVSHIFIWERLCTTIFKGSNGPQSTEILNFLLVNFVELVERFDICKN